MFHTCKNYTNITIQHGMALQKYTKQKIKANKTKPLQNLGTYIHIQIKSILFWLSE